MEFSELKYMHIEHWDTDEVQYLKEAPVLWVQPKIDGTNCCVAYENGNIVIGSRNRFITVEEDNQGCARYIFENLYDKLIAYFKAEGNENNVLYGEFTINNTFKVQPQYLHRFYIFDVYNRDTETYEYPSDKETDFGLDIVPTIAIKKWFDRPYDMVQHLQNELKDFGKFLMEEAFDTGEGYVIKDYANVRRNKYGRTCWAKVLNEKPKVQGKNLWEKIRNDFLTDAWIEKETIKYLERNNLTEIDHFEKYANILTNEFIKEEVANIVIKYKYPSINFQQMKVFVRDILKGL